MISLKFVNLILVLIIELNLIHQYRTKEAKPFYCDKEEALLKTPLSRFTIYKNTAYLIYPKKTISFKMPIIFKNENRRSYYFLNSQPYVHEVDEIDLKRTNESRLAGYHVDYADYKTYEVYYFFKTKDFMMVELDFSELPPRKKADQNEVPIEWVFDRTAWESVGKTFKKFVYLFSVNNKDEQLNSYVLEYYIHGFNVISYIKNPPRTHDIHRKEEQPYDFDFSVLYNYTDDTVAMNNVSVIEYDQKQKLFILRLLENGPYRIPLQEEIKNFIHFPLKNDEFFNCRQKYNNVTQLKGIYYDKQVKSFFIFIRHFYIQIKNDLVDDEFRFPDTYYESAKELKFESNEILKSVWFEDLSSKWIKSVSETETHMVLFDQSFGLSANNDGLIIKKISSLAGDKCILQSLKIDNQVFCFEATYYHQPSDFLKRASISTIFVNTEFKYKSDQTLLFIFNYLDNKFVFMTMTNFYVLNYDWFVFHKSNATITVKAGVKIEEKTNCFFVKCGEKVEQVSKKPDSFLKKYYPFLIGTLVLLVLAVGLCIVGRGIVDQNRGFKEVEIDSKVDQKKRTDESSASDGFKYEGNRKV